MSNIPGRANPFADIDEFPSFPTKAPARAPVAREHIDRIADANDFPSRQPVTAPVVNAPHPRRRFRTGRDRQLNIKATSDVIERFYRMADARHVPFGELLDQALAALEKAGGSDSRG